MDKKSFLYEIQRGKGAKFIDFFGYFCPLYYEGIVEEAKKVRQDFGAFDLFHMGRIFIYKDRNFSSLQEILSIKIQNIKNYSDKGKAKYCLILNENGGIVDDVLIYDYFDKILVVCNAANKEKNLNLFRKVGLSFSDESDSLQMLAIQGPQTAKVMGKIFNTDFSDVYFYEYIIKDGVIFSRTGYTGEDGFEVYGSREFIYEVVKKLLESYGDVLCGLGARDVLRIEAGLPLYGNELDEDTNPYEANLKWAIDSDKKFNKKKSLAYFSVDNSKRIPRKRDKVFLDNQEVGFITSGTFSPLLNKPVGMLYFYGDVFYSRCVAKELMINVYKVPLIKPRYYKKI